MGRRGALKGLRGPRQLFRCFLLVCCSCSCILYPATGGPSAAAAAAAVPVVTDVIEEISTTAATAAAARSNGAAAGPGVTAAIAAIKGGLGPTETVQMPLTVVGTRVALWVRVGGQQLLLGLDSCKEGLRLFASDTAACTSGKLTAALQQQEQQKNKHKQQQHEAAQTAGSAETHSTSEQQQQQQRQQQNDGLAKQQDAHSSEEGKKTDNPKQQRKQQLKKQQQQQTCYNPDASSASSWCLNWHEMCTPFSETPFSCRPSSQHDPQYAARYKQVVDGIFVSELRLEGHDTVEMLPPGYESEEKLNLGGAPGGPQDAAVPSLFALRLSRFPVKLVLDRDTEFDAYKGLDGVWGIAGPDLCCREASLWNLLLEPSVKGVGIDVNLPPSTGHPLPGPPISQEGPQGPFSGRDLLPSNIYFSSNASRIFGEMLWAERMQTGAAGVDALIHFSTFDWRLCGELIGHPLSSAWEAVVDLSSECMVVPPPMWKSLRAWLPLDTEHELCKDPDSEEDSINAHVSRPVTLTDEGGKRAYRRTCPLLQRQNIRPLPSLSFTLSQSSPDAPRLQLPLERLVVREPGVGEVLCVVPQPFLSMGADQWRQIRLGTRVLSAFKVVMDRNNWRVGLQEKSPEPNNDSACAARAACIGEQVYVPYTNRCADPDCSIKILFEMNQETKVCELAWWVPGAVVTAVAALVTLELFVLHLRQKVVAEACSGRQ